MIVNINMPKKVAIIGTGLIGGSIALGLKKELGSKISILGACSNPRRSMMVKKAGIIDKVLDLSSNQTIKSKLVIIAVPILQVIPVIKKILPRLSENTLIIDVASTKEEICEAVKEELSEKITFIGTHPMAGTEKSGFENANANLFENKPWIICPDRNTKIGNIHL